MTIEYAAQLVRDRILEMGVTDGVDKTYGKLDARLAAIGSRR